MGVGGQLSGQSAPTDPVSAGHRDERAGPALGPLPAFPQPAELSLAPDEPRRRGTVELLRQLGAGRRWLERGILAQDRLMQPAQLRPRLHTDLLDEPLARATVFLERLHLPSVAVERQHQLSGEPLPGRIVGHQLSQLADQRSLLAGGEVRIHAGL